MFAFQNKQNLFAYQIEWIFVRNCGLDWFLGLQECLHILQNHCLVFLDCFSERLLSRQSFVKFDGHFTWRILYPNVRIKFEIMFTVKIRPSILTWLTVFGALSVICGTRIEKLVLLFVLELLLLFCLLNVSSTESLGGWSTADRDEITSGFMTSLIGVLFTSIFLCNFQKWNYWWKICNVNWPEVDRKLVKNKRSWAIQYRQSYLLACPTMILIFLRRPRLVKSSFEYLDVLY